jgi:hypothetical protein
MSPTFILVILSAAKDLAKRSDTGRMAGVRFCAMFKTTEEKTRICKALSSN